MRGVVLTDGVTSVDMRGPYPARIHCWDWNDLLGVAPNVGTDQNIPDFVGVESGPHSRTGLLAVLHIRINGRFDASGEVLAGDESDWRDNYLDALDTLYGLIGQTGLLDVTVHEDVEYTGQLRVKDPDRPSGRGHLADLAVSVLVPSGSLARGGS